MTGQATFCTLPELGDIPGADRIKQAFIMGETVVVSADHYAGQPGLLFDIETVLSEDYCRENNLYRHSWLNADKSKSGYIEDDRRIRPIRLRGVKVSGLWMPLDSIFYVKEQLPQGIFNHETSGWAEGHQFNEIRKIKICEKFVRPNHHASRDGMKPGKARFDRTPLFRQHFDTDHALRNLASFEPRSTVHVSEKLHGTSGRAAFLPIKRHWWEYGWKQKYQFMVGSRRVVKSIGEQPGENKEHFYSVDIWTLAANRFKKYLRKNETVYFEIVGYLPNEQYIMNSQSNEKLKNFFSKEEYREILENYGNHTVFQYRTEPGQFRVFVYRHTMTDPKTGDVTEFSYAHMRERWGWLKSAGIDVVPHVSTIIVPEDRKELEQWIVDLTEQPSLEFPGQIKEGICLHLPNGKIMKSKSYAFKILEGIIKETETHNIEEEN